MCAPGNATARTANGARGFRSRASAGSEIGRTVWHGRGMTTLADLRTHVRRDLRDTDPAAYRWDDDQLDRHIANALSELSLAIPAERAETITTTADSRELSLAGIDGLIDVEAVEYPAGQFPPSYAGFATWASTLLLQTETPPNGADAVVYCTARHTLDDDGSTLTSEQADLVAMGASALAALEQSVATANELVTGEQASVRYGDWGRARLTAFRQLLHEYGRRNRVRLRRMYRAG